MKILNICLIAALLILISCKEITEPVEEVLPDPNDHTLQVCSAPGCAQGRVYYLGDKQYLWGGVDPATHFEITDWSLEITQLRDYGYNRETLEALINPPYTRVTNNVSQYKDSEPVIVLKGKTETKVYPYILMKFHEVINETIDGEPVMIAYCFLADLAAVYSRTYCEKVLTFGVSGYTYGDDQIWDGKQGFVLWDRDTESLWWPLIDRGVSGVMKNTQLNKHASSDWSLSTWGEVKTNYPQALVFQSDPSWAPPKKWSKLKCEDVGCCTP